jgi:hypothetical protein
MGLPRWPIKQLAQRYDVSAYCSADLEGRLRRRAADKKEDPRAVEEANAALPGCFLQLIGGNHWKYIISDVYYKKQGKETPQS